MARSIVLATALVGALVLAATTTAAPKPASFGISTTFDAVSTIGGCCSDSVEGQVTTAFPRLGRATLSALFTRCGASYCFPSGENSLFLKFETPSGTLAIEGFATGGTFSATGTWDVASAISTGRFAGATGSGTWSATFTPTGPGGPGGTTPGTLAISLTGSLSHGSG